MRPSGTELILFLPHACARGFILAPLRGWGWGWGWGSDVGQGRRILVLKLVDWMGTMPRRLGGHFSGGSRRFVADFGERGFHHEHFVALRVWEDVESAGWVGGEAGAVSGV